MSISLKEIMTHGEFWLLAFVLSSLLLNWPILDAAAKGPAIQGKPFVIVYILVVWIAIICLLYIFDRRTEP
jgi:hypothetical protein